MRLCNLFNPDSTEKLKRRLRKIDVIVGQRNSEFSFLPRKAKVRLN